ncbi:MAG: AAA family ATPase, partial [Cyanobacteria bacterium J06626_4]
MIRSWASFLATSRYRRWCNMSGQPDTSTSNQINQTTQGDRNQTIGQVYGGIVVYVSGGQAIINQADGSVTAPAPQPQSARPLGANPYKGLLAFDETDGDRYFGRADEIQRLWDLFRNLHNDKNTTRLLPIYGPSGSGKSSLARAGFLYQLSQQSLPERDRARVAMLVPGTQPLSALATILARIAEDDQTPAQKTREFAEELSLANKDEAFDGLQRIASVLPDIQTCPLIVLVDQFEEVYSLCEDPEERRQFIANLLYAAQDRAQYVSVMITCRSDFIGATQEYPELNKLFSTQGFLVPIMQPEGLAAAIAEPATQAGYDFDPATVQLLIEQTRGQQGALPLLQFTLQRIWEGLKQGEPPSVTLKCIGGVGGALADEAKQVYESLNEEEQKLAPRIFVALVQIDDANVVTRRRVTKSELITSDSDKPILESIIEKFSAPAVRFLVTYSTEDGGDIIEVTHEALIRNWTQLQEWIAECREALRQKRKIEREALEWQQQSKLKGYLLQGRPLRDAKEFMQLNASNPNTRLSSLAGEFVGASTKKNKQDLFTRATTVFALPITILTPLIYITSGLLLGSWSLYQNDCRKFVLNDFLLDHRIRFGGKKELSGLRLCDDNNLSNIDLSIDRLDKISNSDFSESNLSGAKFVNSSLASLSFVGSDLTRANFQDSLLQDVKLEDANLEQSIFI